MQVARIKLSGTDPRKVDQLAEEIVKIAKQKGVKHTGIIRLPTKYLKITTRYSPCGDGSETWEHWEMRIHKRLIDVEADETVLRMIMRIPIPEDVKIEIRFINK